MPWGSKRPMGSFAPNQQSTKAKQEEEEQQQQRAPVESWTEMLDMASEIPIDTLVPTLVGSLRTSFPGGQ